MNMCDVSTKMRMLMHTFSFKYDKLEEYNASFLDVVQQATYGKIIIQTAQNSRVLNV